VTASSTGNFSTSGFVFGGTVGANYQVGSLVFGVEADGDWADASGFGTFTASALCAGGCLTTSSWLSTVRGRAGYAFDRFLVYGTGGVALTPWASSVVNTATSQRLDQASGLNYGVAVGAGIEYKPLQNFGVRAEVLHYGVAGWDLDLPTAGTTANQFQSYVGRIGITWYLN